MKKTFVCLGSPGGYWEDFMLDGKVVATIEISTCGDYSVEAPDFCYDIGISAGELTDENCKEALSKTFDCEAEIEWKGESVAVGA